jgi:hypothetical protein
MPNLTVNVTELAGLSWLDLTAQGGPHLRGRVETDADAVVDATADTVYLGSPALDFTDGNAVVSLPATVGTYQYRVLIDYVDGGRSGTWDSGWFDLTADANLADLTTTTVSRRYPTLADAIAAQAAAEAAATEAAQSAQEAAGFAAGPVNSVNGVHPAAGADGDVVLTAADVDAIGDAEKGAANGVASLGADGKVPAGQLPSGSTITSADITDATTTGRAVLTAASQAAARTAIGAGTSSFSGAYPDLTSKPTIPSTAADVGAASRTGGAAEAVAALSATTGTCTANLATASVFTITPTGNWTLAFTNVPAGVSVLVTVIVSEGATARTMTDPAGTTWAKPGAPTATVSKWRELQFHTVDGGTTWRAAYMEQS